jgi:uncharacterized protein (UPF0262 family)
MGMSEAPTARLTDVVLDETIGRSTPDVEHERAVAIYDLIEENVFQPVGDPEGGPYKLKLSLVEARLVFSVSRRNDSVADTVSTCHHRLFYDLRELL